MNIKNWGLGKIIAFTAMLFTFACGVAPEDATDQLDWSADHPEEWCGGLHTDENELDSEVVEKFFQPYGYGRDNAAIGCFNSAWNGNVCFIPGSKEFAVKTAADNQDAAWLGLALDAQSSWVSALNGLDWDITPTGGSAFYQLRTGTTHPNGWLGYAQASSYTYQNGAYGSYVIYEKCSSKLYRTAIEANGAYIAASPAQRSKYIRNMWKHELYHCAGLGHRPSSTNELMSINYGFPGPFFDSLLNPNAAEYGYLEAYEPF